METESSDKITLNNLNESLLQEMFSQTVVQHYQENMSCRLLHTETVVKFMRDSAECKREDKTEAVYSENIGSNGVCEVLVENHQLLLQHRIKYVSFFYINGKLYS